MDAAALARVVDDRILDLPLISQPARLFAVEIHDTDVSLTLLWTGYARELPPTIVPPVEADAIALESTGWAAPMGDGRRASRHPKRRRMHNTTVIFGETEDVSVLRCEGSEPQVLRGVVGLVPDLMWSCWLRRPVAP
jgi:hypothetical protein